MLARLLPWSPPTYFTRSVCVCVLHPPYHVQIICIVSLFFLLYFIFSLCCASCLISLSLSICECWTCVTFNHIRTCTKDNSFIYNPWLVQDQNPDEFSFWIRNLFRFCFFSPFCIIDIVAAVLLCVCIDDCNSLLSVPSYQSLSSCVSLQLLKMEKKKIVQLAFSDVVINEKGILSR